MENETVKILNVLRRIARAAGYAAWAKSEPETKRFCASQYNRVLARLTELEPAIKPLFAPLSDSVSPEVTRIAARELLAYFEANEPESHSSYGHAFFFGCHPRRARAGCSSFSATCD